MTSGLMSSVPTLARAARGDPPPQHTHSHCVCGLNSQPHLWAHVVQRADAALAALQAGVDRQPKVTQLEAAVI